MNGFSRGALTGVLCLGLTMTTAPVRAEVIGTEQILAESSRAEDLQRVQRFMSRDAAVAEFEKFGVDPAEARARVAALSDAELRELAQAIDQQPAGAGALEVIGIVFIVLLILELVGVTHIFSRF